MLPQIRYQPDETGKLPATDDLTEIPMPPETRSQRFISIAESEPFGPVNAAHVLDIEPASKLLEKITSIDIIHHEDSAPKTKELGSQETIVGFTADVLKGEKAVFKFTNAKVGQVGFRYGAARDDQKHNRKIRYNSIGEAKYL